MGGGAEEEGYVVGFRVVGRTAIGDAASSPDGLVGDIVSFFLPAGQSVLRMALI